MTGLPPSSDFTAAANEGDAKAAYDAQRAFLAGLLGTSGNVADALATLGVLAGRFESRTAAAAITTADRGKIVSCTNTWTAALPAVASAGAGFSFVIRNAGSGLITLDPSGSETIDGAATLDINLGRAALVICTGTAWITIALPGAVGGAVLAPSGTAGSPGLAFAGDSDNGFFRLGANQIGAATGGVQRWLLTTTALQIDLPLIGTAVVSGPGDTTAGRLPTTGWMGLGATGSPGESITSAAQLDALRGLRNDRCLAANVATVGGPSGSLGAGILTIGYLSGGATQIWTEVGTNRQWIRSLSGGVWSAWLRITPLLTENSNGGAERTDRWMRTIRTDLTVTNSNIAEGALWRSGDVTWTFPTPFATGVKPAVTCGVEHAAACGWSIISISGTAVTLRIKTTSSVTGAITLNLSAHGRHAV